MKKPHNKNTAASLVEVLIILSLASVVCTANIALMLNIITRYKHLDQYLYQRINQANKTELAYAQHNRTINQPDA